MFAVDIETRPRMDLVDASFKREEFVDKPLDLTKWKLEKTQQKKQTEYDESILERVRDHEKAQNKEYDKVCGKAALDAAVAEVLCVSYHFDSYGDPIRKYRDENVVDWGTCEDPIRGEYDLLHDFWRRALVVQMHGGRVFSCSSTQFDLRFMWRRSLALGLALPDSLRAIEFRGTRANIADTFVDLAEVWAAGAYGSYTKMNALAHAFGVPPKNDGDGVIGPNFWQVHQAEGRGRVEPYALRDSAVVFEIAKKMTECGIFRFEEVHPKHPKQKPARCENRQATWEHGDAVMRDAAEALQDQTV